MEIKDIIRIFKTFGFRDGIRCIKYNIMVEKDMRDAGILTFRPEALIEFFRRIYHINE